MAIQKLPPPLIPPRFLHFSKKKKKKDLSKRKKCCTTKLTLADFFCLHSVRESYIKFIFALEKLVNYIYLISCKSSHAAIMPGFTWHARFYPGIGGYLYLNYYYDNDQKYIEMTIFIYSAFLFIFL